MNISTYEPQIKALETGGGGGGGTSDGVFVITIDADTRTSDKTFSEVKNAVLNKTPILVYMGTIMIPDIVGYVDDTQSITIQVTYWGINAHPTTPSGQAGIMVFSLHPNDALTMDTYHNYTFTVTEV